MNKIVLILFCLLLGSISGQLLARDTTSIEQTEKQLMELYQDFWNPNTSSYTLRKNLVPQFRKGLEDLLSNPNSFDYPFVELAQKIKIRISKDKRVRIFSWDDNTNPDWRHICSIAQYKDDHGKIRIRWLSVGDEYLTGEFTDVWIYGIHELGSGKHKRYMTIGEGTHGEGQHHLCIQIFGIDGKDLVRCQNCFENASDYLVIQAILLDHFNLIYNQEDFEISYSTFERDESSGFYIKTGERTKLRYNGTVFRIVKKR